MLNVGLIGCGNIAETYFRSQEYFNNINFISCADINEEAAKKCADQYNIKAQSVDNLLNNSNIDVVLVCTFFSCFFIYISTTYNIDIIKIFLTSKIRFRNIATTN